MSARIGCFAAAVFLMFINCTVIQAEDGYQECRHDHQHPLVIREPTLLKIEAPPPQHYYDCQIRFEAPAGKYVELEFTELDLGTLEMDYKHMNSCRTLPNVYLFSNDMTMFLIGHPLCGNTNDLTPEQRIRRSNTGLAKLLYSNNGGRFQVQVNFVDSPGQTVCPSSTVELSGSGTIMFPVKEDIYVNNYECRWKITASPGKRVKLTNKKNDLGGYDMYYPYTYCMEALGLEVYDNPTFTSPPVQEFCYGMIGKNVTEMTSTGNVFTLFFSGIQPYFNTGFEMDYKEI